MLVVVWGLITLIGHGSWLLIAGLYRRIIGGPTLSAANSTDRQGFNRVLQQLHERGLIDSAQAETLWNQASQLSGTLASGRPQAPPVQAADDPLVVATIAPNAPPAARSSLAPSAPPSPPHALEPIMASDPFAAPEPGSEPVAAKSQRSWAAVIESFLAVHNIRWGELIAGLLIVICSIGLVISLWSTLVNAHRIVPTMIFLAANAAIFAAGFYTLAKWRLRHTSRAVLMIATLLVPLSVLAGLATASQSQDSVSLHDPITLLAILVSTVVNVMLLQRAGRALYGPRKSWAFAVAVATPAMLIPFIPAALRAAGESSGLMVVPASMAVAVAIVWFQRPWVKRHLSRRYLTATSRHQWTFLAVGVFSLSALAIAISLLGHRFDESLWLRVVSGCVPALIAVAVAAHWTSLRTQLPMHRLVGQVVALMGSGMLLIMLPLFSRDGVWLWWYAGIASISYLALFALYRRAPWLAAAVVPLGLAAILSSTSVLQQMPWSAISWQRRLVGGEPMFTSLLMALIIGAALAVARRSPHRHSFSLLMMIWLGLASIDATLLAFLPDHWRGAVPEAVLIAVLLVLVGANAAAAIFAGIPAVISVAMTLIAAHALFRPFTLADGGNVADATVWLHAFTCAAIILTALGVMADRLLSTRAISALNIADASAHEVVVDRSTHQWRHATAILSLLSLIAAVVAIVDDQFLTQPLSTVIVTLCFLVMATAWFALSLRTDTRRRSTLSAMIVVPASTLWIPAFFDLPLVTWLQITAIVALIWAELTRVVERLVRSDRPLVPSRSQVAFAHAVTAALAVGLGTAVAAIIEPIFGTFGFNASLSWTGWLASVAAVVYAVSRRLSISQRPPDHQPVRLAWPVGISLLTGQMTWLADQWLPQLSQKPVILLFSLFMVAAISSVSRFLLWGRSIDHRHLLVLSLFSLVVAQWTTDLPVGFVLVLLTMVGVASTWRSIESQAFVPAEWSLRPTILYVIAAQAWTLWQSGNSQHELEMTWMLVVICNTTWIVLAGFLPILMRSQASQGQADRLTPELPIIAVSLVCVEVLFYLADGLRSMDPERFIVRLILLQLGTAVLWIRASTWQQLSVPHCLSVMLAGLLAMRLSLVSDFGQAEALTFGTLTMALVSALFAFYFAFIARLHRFSRVRMGLADSPPMGSYALAVIGPLTLSAAASALASVSLMTLDETTSIVHLTIAGVAISALGVGEISERLSKTSLQQYALGLGLLAVYLWASPPSAQQPYPVLAGTMRWFVASVWLIPALLWGIPRTFGQDWSTRWRESLQLAASAAAAVATGSLTAMLAQELALRSASGIPGLPLVLVIGVALTIGALSVISAIVALASGPALNLRAASLSSDHWQLADWPRRALIIAAQILGGITLLHVILCNPEFGWAGLREHWPYLVLVLSFLSVGLVEWTRARNDHVIADTLKQTSLYLPLIPIGGLLLSGKWSAPMLGIVTEIPSVTLVLVVASGYYVMLNRLWASWVSRVLMILLGNSVIWSLLAAQPGWGLLRHPQLWLIPPAFCVLWLVHRYRQHLDGKLASALRYGATLVIYISSTADMLFQQVGNNLWGPIILVLLALAGVGAGVLLRIRPFLYLGTIFVFIGVTSMVWHAQRSIDQVWPWWAFGITTGVALLAGLMSIEKNKGKLKAISAKLAAWES